MSDLRLDISAWRADRAAKNLSEQYAKAQNTERVKMLATLQQAPLDVETATRVQRLLRDEIRKIDPEYQEPVSPWLTAIGLTIAVGFLILVALASLYPRQTESQITAAPVSAIPEQHLIPRPDINRDPVLVATSGATPTPDMTVLVNVRAGTKVRDTVPFGDSYRSGKVVGSTNDGIGVEWANPGSGISMGNYTLAHFAKMLNTGQFVIIPEPTTATPVEVRRAEPVRRAHHVRRH